MGAVDIDIADAVTSALVAGVSFQGSPVPAVRSYAEWDEALEDFDELHVDVVPLQSGPEMSLDARGEVDYTSQVDVGVRYRFGISDQDSVTGRVDTDEMDALKLLVQTIAEFFATDRLADTNVAAWQATEIKLGWSRKHLRQMRQFFGFVRLTFTATRSL
jgi:hypothetical protein